MGARMLRRWVIFPLKDDAPINERLDAVEYFFRHPEVEEAIRPQLELIGDMERIKGCMNVILHDDNVENVSAEEFFGFGYWILAELERISKLFERIKSIPTDEELQAGIESLNFGFFGTLDWYCKRMGITDHSDAEKVPWIRLYKCMEIDSKTGVFTYAKILI